MKAGFAISKTLPTRKEKLSWPQVERKIKVVRNRRKSQNIIRRKRESSKTKRSPNNVWLQQPKDDRIVTNNQASSKRVFGQSGWTVVLSDRFVSSSGSCSQKDGLDSESNRKALGSRSAGLHRSIDIALHMEPIHRCPARAS